MTKALSWLAALRLRTQLTLTMVGFLLVAFVVLHFGTNALVGWLAAGDLASLPEAAQRARAALDNYQVPDAADHQLLLINLKILKEKFILWQGLVVLGLFLLTIAIGGAIAFALATRLAAPIERVTATARKVAAGDLTARAETRGHSSGETAQLVEDFNSMASALEAFDLERRETAAAAAHELRTPLTILRGRMQAIQDGLFPMNDQELAGLIAHVEFLARLVEDLRIVSLAASSQLTLRKTQTDLKDAISALLPIVAQDLQAFIVETSLESAPALIDVARLRQIFLCLIDNARRYAAEGGVVRVETGRQENYVFLRVLDRGRGLPRDKPEQVFDRFWRDDHSRSRDTGGSGLGLSVVRAIALAHEGQAHAANREGGGAMFEIRLPN
jgi:two-component system sensor histidine kinase AdeS